MRDITEHKVNPVNNQITIRANKPNPNGASYRYELTGFDTDTNPAKEDENGYALSFSKQVLMFQNGAADAGVNGITHEALLAIVADRLRGFQTGAFACRENALALTKIEEALHWLNQRTLARMQRGVEGNHTV